MLTKEEIQERLNASTDEYFKITEKRLTLQERLHVANLVILIRSLEKALIKSEAANV